LRVFPDDADEWNKAKNKWEQGRFFCPKGCYAFDYSLILPFSILRRAKNEQGRPKACFVKDLPRDQVQTNDSDMQMEPILARSLLRVCRRQYGPHCALDIAAGVIHQFSPSSGKRIGTIRFNVSPPKHTDYRRDPPLVSRCDTELTNASRAFFQSVRLLPLCAETIALQDRVRWLPFLSSPDDFILDQGPGDKDLAMPAHLQLTIRPQSSQQSRPGISTPTVARDATQTTTKQRQEHLQQQQQQQQQQGQVLLIVAPCGSGKSQMIKATGVAVDIIQDSRTCGKYLASQFGNTRTHLEVDEDTGIERVRTDRDMCSDTQHSLSIVINSISKIAGPPCPPHFCRRDYCHLDQPRQHARRAPTTTQPWPRQKQQQQQ
jgi:hypothetical protein